MLKRESRDLGMFPYGDVESRKETIFECSHQVCGTFMLFDKFPVNRYNTLNHYPNLGTSYLAR